MCDGVQGTVEANQIGKVTKDAVSGTYSLQVFVLQSDLLAYVCCVTQLKCKHGVFNQPGVSNMNGSSNRLLNADVAYLLKLLEICELQTPDISASNQS